MNIQEKIGEIVKKLTDNKDLMASFQKDPVKAVESLIGVDLPDDVIDKIVSGVKAKIGAEKAGELLGSIKKFF